MKYSNAFTMAEVLITLGIIGIIAAMTLPSLIKKYKDVQFKSAYKKAYSELSQILQEALVEQTFTRSTKFSSAATQEELTVIKNKFKVLLDCGNEDIERCWAKGDTVCGGSCSSGSSADGIDMDNGQPQEGSSLCFIDVSGRSWCSFSETENLYLVDTNGFSNPNQFGKDRFPFTIADVDNTRTQDATKYRRIIPYTTFGNGGESKESLNDVLTQNAFCKHPPCYYRSWLLN